MLAEQARIFLVTVQFLTRIPGPHVYSPARMAATPRYFPAVGALIGALVAGAYALAAAFWPPALAAILSTAFSLRLTGAFHEDGFADACDGIGGGATRERALEIMRDSRLGTYGVAGLVLMLSARIAVLALSPVAAVPVLIVLAHGLSRASAVAALATSTYVRDHGTGKPVQDGIDKAGALIAASTTLALVAAGAWLLGAAPVMAGIAGLAIGHGAMRLSYERKLGGYTGDCLGAVQQASDIGFLLGAMAWL